MDLTLKSLSKIVDLIREETVKDIEAQAISLLLNVMIYDPRPLSFKELAKLTKSTDNSVSRYSRILGSDDDHPRGLKCHNLLQSHTLLSDARIKLIKLSPRGSKMKERILSVLGSNFFMETGIRGNRDAPDDISLGHI